MVMDPTPAPSLSWKDLLMGNKIIEQKVDSGSKQSEEDFSLTEGDVKKWVINGIPSIEVSERYGIWRPSKPFQLMDIENGYFLAKFQSPEDYEKILSLGPWLIFGQYLIVQPWTIDFNPELPYPNTVLTWIRFPGLPSHLYKKEILWDIGGMVGKVTKLDFNTDSRARGRYARMEVYVNLGKPLISKLLINGNMQRVEYESLPVVMDSSAVKLQENTVAGNGDFGPWMLVERRTRRASREDNKIGKS
ncbi:hypothetical protein Goari_003133, partial [Gossypium aridum]|nr:hypothetical protein [Gossypium aridum]